MDNRDVIDRRIELAVQTAGHLRSLFARGCGRRFKWRFRRWLGGLKLHACFPFELALDTCLLYERRGIERRLDAFVGIGPRELTPRLRIGLVHQDVVMA